MSNDKEFPIFREANHVVWTRHMIAQPYSKTDEDDEKVDTKSFGKSGCVVIMNQKPYPDLPAKFYDVTKDPQVQKDKRALVIERLLANREFGRMYHEYDPDEEPVTLTKGKVDAMRSKNEELKAEIERLQKVAATSK